MTDALCTALLATLAVIDFRTRRLPDALLLLCAAVGIALQPEPAAFVLHALTGAGCYGLGWALRALGPRRFGEDAFGLGDVRLFGVIGASAGWPLSLWALLAGAVLAGAMAAWGARTGNTAVPIGTAYAAAAAGALGLRLLA